jgi:hypothetical protein
MNTTTKKFMKYAVMPGIMPRLRNLFTTGFGMISFFIAQIYGAVRLLPSHHPYLNPANRGKFGIRHVVTQAAAGLRFEKGHIDQVIVFFLILVGLVILAMQFGLLAAALLVPMAYAGAGGGMPNNFAEFFITPFARNDVAYILMDRVFGVPDIFTDRAGNASCVATSTSCFQINGLNSQAIGEAQWPHPFHEGLHAMLQLYSLGLMVVGLIIFLYYVVAVTVETAETGQPFGRRFNHVWAPIRLVAAFGLLIPIANGLNSAQYITLYAAKYGSGFATNGWNLFMDRVLSGATTPAGPSDRLVATPNAPDPISLLEYATVLQTCWWSENVINERRVCGWMVKRSDTPGGNGNGRQLLTPNTAYADALTFYNNQDVLIRFGEYRLECAGVDSQGQCMSAKQPFSNAADRVGQCEGGYTNGLVAYPQYDGYVSPFCGEVMMRTVSGQDSNQQPADPGSYEIQAQYFELMKALWFGSGDLGCGGAAGTIDQWGIRIAQKFALNADPAGGTGNQFKDQNAPTPTSADMECLITAVQSRMAQAIQQGVANEIADTNLWGFGGLGDLGWGGAAVWYNKIAQANGVVIAAANSLPYVRAYPSVMETVRKENIANNNSVSGRERYKPLEAGGGATRQLTDSDRPIALAEWNAFDLWTDMYPKAAKDPSALVGAIYAVFGLEGLFNMLDNPNVHPLAQLVAIGKSLVDSAIRNLGYYAGSTLVSLVTLGTPVSSITGMMSSFLYQIAMVALGVGFILFYLIPFLPFIYFFFAVGGWVKGIFEAMVGVPLWALAHIRIDGHGLPGDSALGGYYLILEVFLRPILIVFGMVASIIILTAQIYVLHQIWPLVTSNLTGFEDATAAVAAPGTTGNVAFKRGAVDQFFFTVVYAIIVYIQAMASFKLIDLIPDHILRWMGQSVKSFGEQTGDPAENLVRNVGVADSYVQQALGSVDTAVRGTRDSLARSIGKSA